MDVAIVFNMKERKETKDGKRKFSSEMNRLRKLIRHISKLVHLYCCTGQIVVSHGPL